MNMLHGMRNDDAMTATAVKSVQRRDPRRVDKRRRRRKHHPHSKYRPSWLQSYAADEGMSAHQAVQGKTGRQPAEPARLRHRTFGRLTRLMRGRYDLWRVEDRAIRHRIRFR